MGGVCGSQHSIASEVILRDAPGPHDAELQAESRLIGEFAVVLHEINRGLERTVPDQNPAF